VAKKRFAKLPAPPKWHAELTTVGVTGTNGKTTTTRLVGAALGAIVRPVAQVTTVGSFLDEEPFEASFDYGGFVATMEAARARGGRMAAIELTSEALALGFAKAWPCRIGVFTNLTRDHLDSHGSAEHYLASKAQLFMQLPEDGVAVLNGADEATALLMEVVPAHARVIRYAVPSRGPVDDADLVATDVRLDWSGTTVACRGLSAPPELRLRAIGDVFAENALAAFAAAVAAGADAEKAAAAIEAATPPPGRFEVVRREPNVVVDYAHTPDALRRTLLAARKLTRGKGRLVVVFGAGGERDQPKRPMMGEAAMEADAIVITNDNPRGEDPAQIAEQIRAGIAANHDVDVLLDRPSAIRRTVENAAASDTIVLAGRGHEHTEVLPRDAELVPNSR
jgi:UDP-N-acetylmuramoyl-L-alanyl-D-glutamate--2,6-diaminopimelate ligase